MSSPAVLCDVVYAILVDAHEAAALAAISGGAEDVDLGAERERLDELLNTPLGYRDSTNREEAELLVALGLGVRR